MTDVGRQRQIEAGRPADCVTAGCRPRAARSDRLLPNSQIANFPKKGIKTLGIKLSSCLRYDPSECHGCVTTLPTSHLEAAAAVA